ncbi:hypothetical protein PFISCL1PPCAC_20592, partial [Pristionchus fissidentatus]
MRGHRVLHTEICVFRYCRPATVPEWGNIGWLRYGTSETTVLLSHHDEIDGDWSSLDRSASECSTGTFGLRIERESNTSDARIDQITLFDLSECHRSISHNLPRVVGWQILDEDDSAAERSSAPSSSSSSHLSSVGIR